MSVHETEPDASSSATLPGAPVRFPLRAKLAAFAGLLLLAHVLGVGWAALRLTSDHVDRAQRAMQLAIIEAVTRDIEAELAQANDGLDAIGRVVVDESLDVETRLTLAKILVESNEVLDNALLYTAEGTEPEPIVEASAAKLVAPDPLPAALREEAIERNVATGEAVADSHGPRVLVVLPIRFQGEVTGLVASLVPLSGIQQRVELTASAHFAHMPDALFVVDEQLRILAHPDRERAAALASAADEPILAGLDPGALRAKFSTTGEYTRPGGSQVVGTVVGMESRPWALVAQVPTEFAYEPIVDMRNVVVITVSVAAVIALIAAFLLARRITSPLHQLSRFANALSQRNFKTRVDIHTSDELAMVGRAMSQAAAELESSERRIRQELEIRSDLGRYLPAELVDKVVKREQDMGLGGRRREITVMFADVVAFTPLTEKLPPEQVVQILNELFTIVTEIVFRHGGTVDKFIGDCVMAMWGAPTAQPDHAARALEAAEEIISWLEIGNASWEEKYGISVRIAIGINSGEAVVGNVGSESRMEYTAIGTTVNVAARLEAIARPQQILISEQTARLAGEGFQLTPVGERTLAGQQEPLRLFEVVT
ncbi:adenylate/guanylate cyclase domain-containing protein [Paraliomyxa miuraensis]|uniref:adenylate/guanylate cyclase domain-containing protein n=1 Tax=Paraliomyxa miuraensis TaxID=376150 RepID=UPI00224EAF35|nr:adenylate/guanylate cyclase domain-containing protein [Paraliomyxa miuraensis]MCX4246661.1 adenylate/guanylate cyclase domain-containing protein [Paraliomyxa miuraensis]